MTWSVCSAVLGRNTGFADRWQGRVDRLMPASRRHPRARGPDLRRDEENIRAHYDLGNEFFSAFLDETMMYSCARFEREGLSLTDASRAKLDSLCTLLGLGPDDHVVEIGTGWGGFALHAARHHGCAVTTTTISREQYEFATKAVAEAGLADRVTVLNRDYRQLDGRFDKLVSIEMIEAVDWREHDTFFRACSRLLEPGGLMALQAITISDDRFEVRKSRQDFVKHFIFPGGCLPSVGSILSSVSRSTDLRMSYIEDIGAHYVETLRRWRKRFLGADEVLEGLGFDQRFRRMWEFYLAICEAGFADQRISDVQMLLTKQGNI